MDWLFFCFVVVCAIAALLSEWGFYDLRKKTIKDWVQGIFQAPFLICIFIFMVFIQIALNISYRVGLVSPEICVEFSNRVHIFLDRWFGSR